MWKKFAVLFSAVIIFISCNNSSKFIVNGTIVDAKDSTLYFVYNGLVKDSLIDSVKLSANGDFSFKTKKPKYPDLYSLTLGSQKIILGADSTTNNIIIDGNVKNLINAKIENSPASIDIQTLRKSVIALQDAIYLINKEKDSAKRKTLLDSFSIQVDKHKKIAQELIVKNPASIAAYFALYQQVDGMYIISPYNKSERPYFGAVATSFDTYMPNYSRSKSLHNLVISAMQNEKATQQQQLISSLQAQSQIGFPEIVLRDVAGNIRKLSELKGKIILLDFSATDMPNYSNYIFELRDIYNKDAGKGLQIYQVSLNDNEMLWKRTAINLPWISVYGGNPVTSQAVSLYNVQTIPTIFLINKAGEIVGRYTDFEVLKKNLQRIL